MVHATAAARLRAPSAAASHIVLETTSEEAPTTRRPETPIARYELKTLFPGTRTRLTLYKEGLLAMRTEGGGARRKELLLDLRYLDSRPTVSRVVAMRLLYPAGGAAALAAVLVVLAAAGPLSPTACLLPAFALGLTAGAFAWRFLQRTGERAVFRTARGQAEVLELFGSIGAIGTLRRIVPAVAAGIRAAAEPRADKTTYLREEMREHYRLSEAGAISAQECSTCTQRILHLF